MTIAINRPRTQSSDLVVDKRMLQRAARSLYLSAISTWILAMPWPVQADNGSRVSIHGNVRSVDGTPICAMVLANGQHVFSCDGTGAYNLDVPLDQNGEVSLLSFADGFAPYSRTAMPGAFPLGVLMRQGAPDSPRIRISLHAERVSDERVRLSGEIESTQGDPLCAMVLASGQHMFTCGDSLGRYDLTIPAIHHEGIRLFGFADGFQPYRYTFPAPSFRPVDGADGFLTANAVEIIHAEVVGENLHVVNYLPGDRTEQPMRIHRRIADNTIEEANVEDPWTSPYFDMDGDAMQSYGDYEYVAEPVYEAWEDGPIGETWTPELALYQLLQAGFGTDFGYIPGETNTDGRFEKRFEPSIYSTVAHTQFHCQIPLSEVTGTQGVRVSFDRGRSWFDFD